MSKTNNPAITILMSVYNAEKYLKEAVESILNQTFNDFEFIIIDDGSTDGSASIIREYAAADSRIVCIRHHNKGLTASLNIGLKLARGKYVARQDADDISLPHRLAVQSAFLAAHEDYVLVASRYDEIDGQGRLTGKQRVRFVEDNTSIRRRLYSFNPFFHSSVMVRKEILDQLGGYNERCVYAQDYELWLRIGTQYKVHNINEVLTLRRFSDNMISVSKEAAQLRSVIAIKSRYIRCFRPVDYYYFIRNIIKYIIKVFQRSY